MAIESAVMFRRVVRIACLVLLLGLLFGSAATAQLPITFTPGTLLLSQRARSFPSITATRVRGARSTQ